MYRRRKPPSDSPAMAIEKSQKLLSDHRYEDAQQKLYETLAYRQRAQFEDVYERTMDLYITIGVEALLSCKEGFIRYRTLVQQNHSQSLEKMLNKLLDMAELKGETAISSFEEQSLELRDMQEEMYAAAENERQLSDEWYAEMLNELQLSQFSNIILNYVWDSYQTVLMILKNNGKLNHVYGKTVERCLRFCTRLNRSSELKKLCDTVRRRLTYIDYNQKFDYAVKISSSEILNAMISTRLQLLQCCLEMRLHQESFKCTNDIQMILQRTRDLKKSIDPLWLSLFYERVSNVFWKCEQYLLHAYALHESYKYRLKYYQSLGKKQKKDKEEQERKSEQLLVQSMLAALIVPQNKSRSELILSTDQSLYQLASQFQFSNQPSKSALLAILLSNETLPVIARVLYHVVYYVFDPFHFMQRYSDTIIQLHDMYDINIQCYIHKIQFLGIVCLLRQLSRVYSSISWIRFIQLCKRELSIISINDDNTIMSDETLECLVSSVARDGNVCCRICHNTGMIIIEDESMECMMFNKHLIQLSAGMSTFMKERNNEQSNKSSEMQRENVMAEVKSNLDDGRVMIDHRLNSILQNKREQERYEHYQFVQTQKKEQMVKAQERQLKVDREEKQNRMRQQEMDKKEKKQKERASFERQAKDVEKIIASNIMKKKTKMISVGESKKNTSSSSSSSGVKNQKNIKSFAQRMRDKSSNAVIVQSSGGGDGAEEVLAKKEKELIAILEDIKRGSTEKLNLQTLEDQRTAYVQMLREGGKRRQVQERLQFDYKTRAFRMYCAPKVQLLMTNAKMAHIAIQKTKFKQQNMERMRQHSSDIQQRNRLRFICNKFSPEFEEMVRKQIEQQSKVNLNVSAPEQQSIQVQTEPKKATKTAFSQRITKGGKQSFSRSINKSSDLK